MGGSYATVTHFFISTEAEMQIACSVIAFIGLVILLVVVIGVLGNYCDAGIVEAICPIIP